MQIDNQIAKIIHKYGGDESCIFIEENDYDRPLFEYWEVCDIIFRNFYIDNSKKKFFMIHREVNLKSKVMASKVSE